MELESRIRSQDGFSLIELMVSILILIPVMAAALSLFSVGVRQQASEQTSVDANQEARSGLEMMSMEIAQAGSHGDRSTVTTSSVSASTSPQAVSVAASAGFTAGDWVDVDTGSNLETVQLTAVGDGTLSAVFRVAHASGVPVRLFALPFINGIIPPPGLGADSSAAVTTLRFFGDMVGDSNLYYVEYSYDSDNNQITRSMTPITQSAKNEALPIVRNVKPGTVGFTLYTNGLGIVNSAAIKMTVQNTWKSGTKYHETELSTRVVIPSAAAASTLLEELHAYGGVNRFTATPSRVTTWAGQYEYEEP
jgi:Tfp pilus assembly protein PilW